jgi:hypothetical protein
MIALAIPALATDVQKRNWYILDYGKGQCTVARSFMPAGSGIDSPEKLHAYLRSQGVADKVQVTKNYQGIVVEVQIERPHDGTVSTSEWFPTADLCNLARVLEMKAGNIANPDDLK